MLRILKKMVIYCSFSSVIKYSVVYYTLQWQLISLVNHVTNYQ